MSKSELAKIEDLKSDATAARNLEDYSDALALFQDAIDALISLQEKVDPNDPQAREIRTALADTYGMRGGTYRRMSELKNALNEYKLGRDIERADKLTTYNTSNTITLGITVENQSPLDAQLKEDIDTVIAELKKTTAGPRGDEWWAWSDLGQFYLLCNLPSEAREAYGRATKTGPTKDELLRHIQILKELRDATEQKAPDIARNIADAIAYLTPQRINERTT